MDKQNDMAQLRYLEEAAISLKRAGFDTGRIEDRHLPVSWNGQLPVPHLRQRQCPVSSAECGSKWRTGGAAKSNRHRKNDF